MNLRRLRGIARTQKPRTVTRSCTGKLLAAALAWYGSPKAVASAYAGYPPQAGAGPASPAQVGRGRQVSHGPPLGRSGA